MKRGYNTPSMMVSQSVPGKPYAVPSNWARVVHTTDGEATMTPIRTAGEPAPAQIIYATDGTQYYAVAKGSGFSPPTTINAQPASGASQFILSPQPVASSPAPQQQLVAASINGASTPTTPTTNYPAYVTVPLPNTSTAIFQPVAIPVHGMQGIPPGAFIIRQPYPGQTPVYASPTVLHTSAQSPAPAATSPVPIYQSIEQRTIETQTAAAAATVKQESTNTIVKTPDGETIVIIQRPMEGGYPFTTTNGIPIGQPQIIKQQLVSPQSQHQDIKQIIIEQPSNTQS